MYREGGRAGVGAYSGGGEEEKSCYNFLKYHTGFSTSLQSLVMKGLDEASCNTFSSTLLGSGSKIFFTAYYLLVRRSSQRRTYKKIDRYFGIGHGFQMERLIGAVLPAFFDSIPVKFERTSCYYLTRKLFPDIIHLLEKEKIT